jgi:DNA-binding response OmpR family regulator
MSTVHTILVIDDEPLLRRSLALILQRAGHQVTTAGSAAEARHCLEAGPFNLIFLDLKMPQVDGLTLLAEIRAHDSDTPVLILTAHATLESAMEAVRQGARDYLVKPFEPEAIVARVDQILASQERPRSRREITSQLDELLGELQSLDGPQATRLSPAEGDESGALAPEPARYLQRGKLTLDLHTRRVLVRGQQILLPPSTFDYLVTLVRHSPNGVSYQTLVEESQGYHLSRAEAREMVRGRIHELRKALELDMRHPELVITVRDVGYRLVT